jgi:exodeoxyribonuclease VII large subunit
VSGVGHETDFTIADFVADVRAPTPTGASQLVCPDRQEIIRHGEIMHGRLQRAMQRGIESRMQHIDMLECRLVHPGKRINDQLGHLQHLRERLARSWQQDLARRYWRLRELDQRLLIASPDIPRLVERQHDLGLRMRRAIAVRIETLVMTLQRQEENLAHLNPESVLERGYSIVYGTGGAVVRSSDQIDVGDTIRVEFAKGGSQARVTEKNE